MQLYAYIATVTCHHLSKRDLGAIAIQRLVRINWQITQRCGTNEANEFFISVSAPSSTLLTLEPAV